MRQENLKIEDVGRYTQNLTQIITNNDKKNVNITYLVSSIITTVNRKQQVIGRIHLYLHLHEHSCSNIRFV